MQSEGLQLLLHHEQSQTKLSKRILEAHNRIKENSFSFSVGRELQQSPSLNVLNGTLLSQSQSLGNAKDVTVSAETQHTTTQ